MSKLKANIKVTLKKGIFDPQGETVKKSLNTLGFNDVSSVRIGKYIEVELNATSIENAKEEVSKMCDQLLANFNIEAYDFDIMEA